MPLSAPEYWLEWTKNYFRCQFNHVGELIHKETWSAASFGWAEGLQKINPPIYRLTTAVSDIDQTNINRDIRDGNWLSNSVLLFLSTHVYCCYAKFQMLKGVVLVLLIAVACTNCLKFRPRVTLRAGLLPHMLCPFLRTQEISGNRSSSKSLFDRVWDG